MNNLKNKLAAFLAVLAILLVMIFIGSFVPVTDTVFDDVIRGSGAVTLIVVVLVFIADVMSIGGKGK